MAYKLSAQAKKTTPPPKKPKHEDTKKSSFTLLDDTRHPERSGRIDIEKNYHPMPPIVEKNAETAREPCILNDSSKTNESEIIERIEFKVDNNTLSLVLSKTHNRMYKVQILLNNETAIRPVTYNGSATAYGYWELLKGAMKK